MRLRRPPPLAGLCDGAASGRRPTERSRTRRRRRRPSRRGGRGRSGGGRRKRERECSLSEECLLLRGRSMASWTSARVVRSANNAPERLAWTRPANDNATERRHRANDNQWPRRQPASVVAAVAAVVAAAAAVADEIGRRRRRRAHLAEENERERERGSRVAAARAGGSSAPARIEHASRGARITQIGRQKPIR